ncbi:MAG: RluA family pseudouridine synthase [Desulfamplus sp.]|nr:RluA family pseudouridine synthase [Desulfamplus sp.]
MEIKFVVTSDFEDKRLDCVVTAKTTEIECSRSLITQLIKNGDILVSGQIRKPSYRVHTGDLISGLLPDVPESNRFIWEYPIQENIDSSHSVKNYTEPEGSLVADSSASLPFDIIHEDDHILVINKNVGVVVHPAPGNLSSTLVHALISYYPAIRCVGEDLFRPGIVHRLDRDTSGVMVVAKENRAFFFLKKEFMQRRIEKRYLAIVSGNIKEDAGQIVLPIGRHPVNRKMMSTSTENGRYAETLWQVRQRYDGATLVEVELKTGRTHQIRVHFRSLGHPLVGDTVYGFKQRRHSVAFKNMFSFCGKNWNRGTGDTRMVENRISRQMLHAWKLSFRHPWSGRRVEFTAPVADDMARFIDYPGDQL